MKILVIDNYDSFTSNLVQIIEQSGLCNFELVKNDSVHPSYAQDFDGILISPGPGIPKQAGISCDLIRMMSPEKNVLGVCLGHQAIAEVFGGTLYNLPVVRHGMKVNVKIIGDGILFSGIENEFIAGLYHSWAVEAKNLPSCLEITAISNEGVIMAIRHKDYNVRGVQFHPESIMTASGPRIIRNWLKSVNAGADRKKYDDSLL